jgi:hypothetical protein
MVFYPDNNVGGPSALSNVKDVCVKSCAITTADTFSTTVLKAILPADSTVIGMALLIPVGTATATVSVGDAGGATTYINAASAATAGQTWPTMLKAGNVSGIPLGPDARITVTVGTATLTSNIFLQIFYVR